MKKRKYPPGMDALEKYEPLSRSKRAEYYEMSLPRKKTRVETSVSHSSSRSSTFSNPKQGWEKAAQLLFLTANNNLAPGNINKLVMTSTKQYLLICVQSVLIHSHTNLSNESLTFTTSTKLTTLLMQKKYIKNNHAKELGSSPIRVLYCKL